MISSTTAVVEKSPFFVRTSCTLAQSSAIMADWAMKRGLTKAVTLVTEFAPGLEAEETFTNNYWAGGGKITEAIRVPLRSSASRTRPRWHSSSLFLPRRPRALPGNSLRADSTRPACADRSGRSY